MEPTKENQYILERQDDGNWIGRAFKYNKQIETREIDPQTALLKLLTHSGE